MFFSSLKKLSSGRLIALIVMIAGGSLFAQNSAGVSFLRLDIGSRAQAMGSAYTALATNANGIHFNPAGMGFGQNREIMLYHAQWFADISVENVTFMYPFSSRFSIGSSVSFLHTPQFTRYEVDPLTGGPIESGTFSVYDLVVTTGLGYRINNSVSIGANVKYFQESLEATNARGVAFDVGLLTTIPSTGLRLGFAVQNIGAPVQYIESKESLPTTIRAGFAYQMSSINSIFALDVTKTSGENFRFLPGIEFGLSNSLFLRGGYQVTGKEGDGLAAGFGLRMLGSHKINYVYAPYGDLGDTHRAELIFHLGTAPVNIPYGGAEKYISSKSNDRARESINQQQEKTSLIEELAAYESENNSVVRAPVDLNIEKKPNNKMKLVWAEVRGENIKYLIYAKREGGSKWIKLTPSPIQNNYQLFTQKRDNVKLVFAVTSIRGEEESDFSQPVFLTIP